MKSIDKLRRHVYDTLTRSAAYHINDMIDAIEREVEEMRDREYQNGREDAKGAVEFADRLCRASERREDVTLWGVDYTPLPEDADGVPIHVGDVMEWIDEPDVSRVVSSIQLAGDGWWVYINGTGRRPDKYRHHHAPTVEDVLREFGAGWYEQMSGPETFDIADYVERYAARLRLAGDE